MLDFGRPAERRAVVNDGQADRGRPGDRVEGDAAAGEVRPVAAERPASEERTRGIAMRNLVRVLGLTAALGALLLLPSVACLQESPSFDPQYFYSGHRGPSGTSAFVSGEAAKAGMKPVKEGAMVTDAGGEEDAGGGSVGKDVKETQPPEDTGDAPKENCENDVDDDGDGGTDCGDDDCILDDACIMG